MWVRFAIRLIINSNSIWGNLPGRRCFRLWMYPLYLALHVNVCLWCLFLQLLCNCIRNTISPWGGFNNTLPFTVSLPFPMPFPFPSSVTIYFPIPSFVPFPLWSLTEHPVCPPGLRSGQCHCHCHERSIRRWAHGVPPTVSHRSNVPVQFQVWLPPATRPFRWVSLQCTLLNSQHSLLPSSIGVLIISRHNLSVQYAV